MQSLFLLKISIFDKNSSFISELLYQADTKNKKISYLIEEEIMNDKIAIYDLSLDKRTQKIGHGKKLQKYSLEKLPKFLQNNIVNYQEWID